jgi:hypothetical protein
MSQTSRLARFLGLFFIILGVGGVLNGPHMMAVLREIQHSHFAQLVAAIIPVLLGSFIVASHNVWTKSWGVAVTIMGWLMLIGGAFRAWMPALWVSMFPDYMNANMIVPSSGVGVVIGLLFLYGGFKK